MAQTLLVPTLGLNINLFKELSGYATLKPQKIEAVETGSEVVLVYLYIHRYKDRVQLKHQT